MGTSWKNIIFVNMGLNKGKCPQMYVRGTMLLCLFWEAFEYIMFIMYFTKMRIGKNIKIGLIKSRKAWI